MHYYSQGESNWCTIDLKEKLTGALLFSRRRKLVYCYYRGEGNRCTTVLKEKETGLLLSSEERIWCSTVLKRLKQVIYCFQEKGDGAVLYSRERKGCCTKVTR